MTFAGVSGGHEGDRRVRPGGMAHGELDRRGTVGWQNPNRGRGPRFFFFATHGWRVTSRPPPYGNVPLGAPPHTPPPPDGHFRAAAASPKGRAVWSARRPRAAGCRRFCAGRNGGRGDVPAGVDRCGGVMYNSRTRIRAPAREWRGGGFHGKAFRAPRLPKTKGSPLTACGCTARRPSKSRGRPAMRRLPEKSRLPGNALPAQRPRAHNRIVKTEL